VKFGLIIPTKDRPRDIETLLVSIERQSAAPACVVIVDGGAQPLDAVLRKHPSIPIKYVREKTSITEARNRGIAELDPAVQFVAFLDDDLVFQPGALEQMMRFWATADRNIGGAGFNIINHPMPRIGNVFKWPFILDSRAQGMILPSGYNTIYCPTERTQKVSWLYGGATMWRREVLSAFKFDEWYEGYGLMEDVDFSYNVSKKYDLYVVAGAAVLHLHAAGERVADVTFGQMQIINRYNFVRKHSELSLPLFWWASVGQAVENIARWIVFRKKSFLLKCFGNLAAMARLLANPKAQIRLNHRPKSAAGGMAAAGAESVPPDGPVTISVVIPAYNAQDYIMPCLESVFA
jgi:glycosyltransferase involved in cell wall biosynthesis